MPVTSASEAPAEVAAPPFGAVGSKAAAVWWWTAAALVGWLLIIFAANRWGFALLADGYEHRILSSPLIGRQIWRVNLRAALPVGVAIAGIWFLPQWARTLPWRRLLALSAIGALVWACSLAIVDGWFWLQRPMGLPGHYLLDVPKLGPAGDFLRSYVARIDEFGPHVRAHPPLFVLLLAGLDGVGASGSGWAAALVIVVGSLAVPAVLVTVREVGGEQVARLAAPFLVLAPIALYVATTADALFGGVGAWAIALVVLASGRSDRRGDQLAVLGGLLFGVTMFLSYGLVLLGIVPLVVCVQRRRARPILVAGVAAAAVVAVVAAGGFWWLDGILATRGEYDESVARFRPYVPFLVMNAAAFAIICGPAAAVALSRLREHPSLPGVALLAGAGVAMAVLAGASGMSKGEVERIWLPFAWWVLVGCAVLGATRHGGRGWLALQAGTAVAVQLAIRTHW